MKLSELMSSFGLWIFPVVGLLGFFAAFLNVAVSAIRKPRTEMDHNAGIPLNDGSEQGMDQVARAAGGGQA